MKDLIGNAIDAARKTAFKGAELSFKILFLTHFSRFRFAKEDRSKEETAFELHHFKECRMRMASVVKDEEEESSTFPSPVTSSRERKRRRGRRSGESPSSSSLTSPETGEN